MQKANAAQAGYTMVEVMIVTAIFASVMAACFSIIVSSNKVEMRSISSGQLYEQARVLSERIARGLRFSGLSSPNFSVSEQEGVTTGSFRKCLGFDSQLELPSWGSLITYELRAMPGSGETDITDGVDNNGNGVVDECGLFGLVEGARARLLARDLEASQFRMQLVGSTVNIRIGLARPDPTVRGDVLRGVYETSVVLRN